MSRRDRPQQLAVFTIGHSTRTLEGFLSLLQAHAVTRVVDVRTIPRSRHNPQYSQEHLPESLRAHAIGYTHLPGLGGLRHARRDSPNGGWENASFRGFADYMQTPEFGEALHQLLAMAQHERIAVMCAEAVPWRCHRSLIADALSIRGVSVAHILSRAGARPHRLTSWARIHGTQITYPPADAHG